jgi:methylglyoxal synthase
MNGNWPGPLPVFYRLAVGSSLWHLVRGIPKSVSNAGIGLDSNLRTAEGRYRPPSTGINASRRRIALVAHDSQKQKLASWAARERARLIEHDLYATAHTADLIAATLNVPVFRLLSGPLGGDQQIGSRIAESRIDVLVFFWDPLGLHAHDCDVKALLRVAAAYNIPNACNEATADCIISALTTKTGERLTATGSLKEQQKLREVG